ncbi:histidine acid phosphatase [Colletotrichum truncatum]|uniref:Histidine acid phosphatase n=1 Tax=Colletotrichum truncatum TaxID=5467 RepID=A0ACC3ZB79_COLTU|nr:histidine acid phosphatase [Colletotrichum truncatum]KAF6796304.1 histidine acid phosphatase [Colletotrichum truncatum]
MKMSALSLVAISALLAPVTGQAFTPVGSPSVNITGAPSVWASVAMIMHGERTPLRSNLAGALTPYGAQQLYAQGSAFRTRYLAGTTFTNETEDKITYRAPIRDISRNVIEHPQLHILSVPDAHISSSAAAFMQGLYPPIPQAFSDDAGGKNISYSTISENFTQYPLDGYQYPVIQTVGLLDERSIYLRGNAECTQWDVSTRNDRTQNTDIRKLYDSSLSSYQALFSKSPLNDGVIPLTHANFWDAYNIWDYVRYRYTHEQAVHDAMMATYNKDSQFLQLYSRQQQLALYSDTQSSGLKEGDMIRTVAGRTFARNVVEMLSANGNFKGYSHKMTLMFSSQEPFLSFFTLAKLQRQGVPTDSPFWNVPEPGAAMVFELIGDEPNNYDSYPKEENLYVRFMYRKNADPETPFEEHALFGSTAAEPRVTFSYFKQEMLKFGVDISEWCAMCEANSPFCGVSREKNSAGGDSIRSAVKKPVVAGIIGAAIILAVLGLVVLAAVLGGFRIRRQRKGGNKGGADASGLGSLKAAEKRASDPDLSVSRQGVKHARQGSWEMNEGHDVATGLVGASMTKSSASYRSMSIDSTGSTLGGLPVCPREHF